MRVPEPPRIFITRYYNTVFVITTLHASFTQVAVGYNSASSQTTTTTTTTKSCHVKPACLPPRKSFFSYLHGLDLYRVDTGVTAFAECPKTRDPVFINISLRKNNLELCHHASLLLSVTEGVGKVQYHCNNDNKVKN